MLCSQQSARVGVGVDLVQRLAHAGMDQSTVDVLSCQANQLTFLVESSAKCQVPTRPSRQGRRVRVPEGQPDLAST